MSTSALPVRSSRLARFWSSSVGKKIVMGVTGLVMAGFLIVHMTGNLLAFLGPEYINDYSHFLHAVPEVLWPARVVLLLSVVLHATAALQLTRMSAAARPHEYEMRESQVATYASRSIRWLSILVAMFIVMHLLHFTTGTLLPGFAETDPYGNLVLAFTTQRAMAGVYVAMMVVVGLHLYHGTWSAIRTLGLSRPKTHPLARPIATALAIALWLGFTAVPVGVLVGLLRPTEAGAVAERATMGSAHGPGAEPTGLPEAGK